MKPSQRRPVAVLLVAALLAGQGQGGLAQVAEVAVAAGLGGGAAAKAGVGLAPISAPRGPQLQAPAALPAAAPGLLLDARDGSVVPGPSGAAALAAGAGGAASPALAEALPYPGPPGRAPAAAAAAQDARARAAVDPSLPSLPGGQPAPAAPQLKAWVETLGSGLSSEAKEFLLRRGYDDEAFRPSAAAAVETGSAGAAWRVAGLLEASVAERLSAGGPAGEVPAGRVEQLKAVLGDSALKRTRPFVFHVGPAAFAARGPGLEGFLYSKLELEHHIGGMLSDQLGHMFSYLDHLLAPVASAAGLRAEIAALGREELAPRDKNSRLNEKLKKAVAFLRAELRRADPSQRGRSAHTYSILSRAYNRLRPGRTFFDSLDDEELDRIVAETHAEQLWLLDIFEIGEVSGLPGGGRWGTGGGSPYTLKGYHRVKPELGGMEGFKAFIARAHAKGLRVGTDFVPNHTALDGDMIARHPEATLHLVPPQDLPDAEIMKAVPSAGKGDYRSPIYHLLKTRSYPGREGLETKLLVRYPGTDEGDLWLDMAQIDFTRRSARAWLLSEVRFLFGDLGIDYVRRDMAYYVSNRPFHDRWSKTLANEEEQAAGWYKTELQRVLREFDARWKDVENEDFLERMSREAKAVRPGAVLVDEAYNFAGRLGAAGSDGVYNKNTHGEADAGGQVGLYDALRSRDVGAIRAALWHLAFRSWQAGGAAAVNFIWNHDETNAVDVFKGHARAAAALALLAGPIITYNGFENGVGREAMLGPLKGSRDLGKGIPFDVPVAIRWDKVDPANRDFFRALFALRSRHRDLAGSGAMTVLEPIGAAGELLAYSLSGPGELGTQRALIVAANMTDHQAAGAFGLSRPVLGSFGAFTPRPDRSYRLYDHANRSEGGLAVYVRSGKDLLEQGLYVSLPSGGVHLFEVEEFDPAAPVLGPPLPAAAAAATGAALGPDAPERAPDFDRGSEPALGGSKARSWLRAPWGPSPDGRANWVDRLVYFAMAPFLFLQVPQIVSNFGFMASDPAKVAILPWIGYATGILANSNLWGYHVDGKRHAVAAVQGLGVATSAVVLGQIAAVGAMPAAAAVAVGALVLTSVAVNALRWSGRLSDRLWGAWNGAAKLLGLFALPFGFAVTFGLLGAHAGAVLGASVAFAAAGAAAMALDRRARLPSSLKGVWTTLGAWLATLLFVFLPIPQLVNIFERPQDIAGIAIGTVLLSTFGNLLEVTGSVAHKSQIWFVGSFWAVAVGGWGVLASLALLGALSPLAFAGFSAAVAGYLAWVLHQAKRHHRHANLWETVRFALLGDKK
ncbi:MAG: hypothetical protein HY554_11390 [Elusimicrobia bacterium]|nr:hypothetical protein [Elusimicrobiota bacterium]